MTNLCLVSLLLKEKLVHLGEEKEQWAWDKMFPKSYPHSKFSYSSIDHIRFSLDQPKTHPDVHISLNTRDALPAIPSKQLKFPWLSKGCSRAAPSLGLIPTTGCYWESVASLGIIGLGPFLWSPPQFILPAQALNGPKFAEDGRRQPSNYNRRC